MPKIAQLHPPQGEKLAASFEALAEEARAGECIGYSMIILKPGGKWTTRGFSSKEVSVFEELGMHFTCMMSIYTACVGE